MSELSAGILSILLIVAAFMTSCSEPSPQGGAVVRSTFSEQLTQNGPAIAGGAILLIAIECRRSPVWIDLVIRI